MGLEYLVTTASHADELAEALTRLHAAKHGHTYGEALTPGSEQAPYVHLHLSPIFNRERTLAAFGPRDEFLDECLGKTVIGTFGETVVPSTYEELETSWFPHSTLPPAPTE